MPLISVVVVTRNRSTSLVRTLKSLRQLDYPSYEIIVVDNGSVDNTAAVVKEFSAKYVFSSPANGISLSRQLGIDAARGEIIAFCDDDCLPVSDWLQHFARRLCSQENLGLVGGHIDNVGFTGAKRFKGRTKLERNGQLKFVENPHEADFFGNANVAFKRCALQLIGGYDPFFKAARAEIDMAMRIRKHGFQIDYEPAAVVEHHHTGINFKQGRLFNGHQLMRLYFCMKHCQPTTLKGWIRFLCYELKLFWIDTIRALRMLASAILKRKFQRLAPAGIEFFNAISARVVLPWLCYRANVRSQVEKNERALTKSTATAEV